jgi:drug/metabolite transporter (DMT)-like permease
MRPYALNVFKSVVALALLVPMLGRGTPLAAYATSDALLLAASGVLGIGVADTLFLRSLNILGASRSAIVDCLYSPSVVLFSFLLLGERTTPADAVGGGLVVAAVVVAGHGRWKRESLHGGFLEGVLLGALAMAVMAFSIVAVKPVLERQPVAWATGIRLAGGLASLLLVALPFRTHRASLGDAFRNRSAWRFAIPGSIAGAWLALLFWIAGFKFAPANEAAILNQTSTLMVVLLAAAFLDERLTLRRAVAVTLGFAGSVLAVV